MSMKRILIWTWFLAYALMDVNTLTMEQFDEEVFEKPITINQQYNNYWENEEEILQTARYFLINAKEQVDGVIFLISFACGPDSLIQN